MDQVRKILTEKTQIFDHFGDQIRFLKTLAKKAHVNTGMFIAAALFLFGLTMLLI